MKTAPACDWLAVVDLRLPLACTFTSAQSHGQFTKEVQWRSAGCGWLTMQLSCMAHAWSSSSMGGHSFRHSIVGWVTELLHEGHACPSQQSSNPPWTWPFSSLLLTARGREQGQRYMCQTTPAAIAQAGNGLFVVKLDWVWLDEAVDTQ